jgi:hypothetical protein
MSRPVSRFAPALLFFVTAAAVWPGDPVVAFLLSVFAVVGAMVPLSADAAEQRLPVPVQPAD